MQKRAAYDYGHMPFGVGCFHFTYANTDQGITTRAWADLVKQTLLSIPSVSDVSVDCGDDPDLTWEPDASGDDIDDFYGDFYPNPSGACIRFAVTIPRRLHSSLFDGLGKQSERFEVVTEYGYEAPATFIYALDVVGQRGSSGVILVREFLRKELRQRTDELVLRTLGPSPFHVDFVLAGVDRSSQPGVPDLLDEFGHWSLEREVRPGYDVLLYGYSISRFESIDEARDVMMRDLVGEVSLFYELRLRSNRRRRDADRLVSDAGLLVGMHQRRGFWGMLTRLFRSGHTARSLGISALRAQVTSEEDAAYARAEIEDIYSGARPLAQSEKKLRNVAFEEYGPEIRNALEVVSFLEGGRSKEWEVAVLAAATALGALAGAGASLLAR
ncbi:hypothetical protein OG984_29145 [Nocardioides sp. NBC_00368]|uniref:hypothetical protein n=1 Tax=Nocardioides sp. NBC_00368 TaxID=2976000 RepID=UPI002E1A37ED